jgi:hypothetical protein
VPNPPRTPDHIREQVIADIRELTLAGDPEGSVRAIARRYNIGKTTVGRIADEANLGDAWAQGTAQTAQATESRRAYIAAQRARMQEDLLDGAADLLERMQDRVVHLNVVKCIPQAIDDEPDGLLAIERVEHTELPPGPADYRAMAAAVTSFTKAAVELAKLDNDTSRTDSVTGLLDQFAADLARDTE